MNSKFLSKVENYIEENHMLNMGDTVVMGVSGGADSVALFLVLNALREKYCLNLYTVHVNHGLREEAKEEALYVKALCEERDIPFILIEEDVAEIARQYSMGTEEAGRMIRYEAFYNLIFELGGGKVAVAHNMNDRAETMLFNLFRGTGIKGLASINAVRGDIIRPLLCVERSEIEEFVNGENIRFCVDASNLTDDYSRNRIRNNIIPLIKEQIAPLAVSHMAETANQLNELYEYVNGVCESAFKEIAMVEPKTVSFNKELFFLHDNYIRKLLIKRSIDELVPNNKDITHIHIESALDLLNKEGTKSVDLPYGIRVVSEYDTFRLTTKSKEEEYTAKYTMNTVVETYKEDMDLSDNKYTKCFDYDKIKGSLRFRTRETGDTITVTKDGGKKKLKDYMINEKIPLSERDKIPVLAVGSDVLWVIGYRMSEEYKVSKETKRVLKVTVLKEE